MENANPLYPSDMEIYLFDLGGYLRLPKALNENEVSVLNRALDSMPSLQPGDWSGYVHGHSYRTSDGINYQQIGAVEFPFPIGGGDLGEPLLVGPFAASRERDPGPVKFEDLAGFVTGLSEIPDPNNLTATAQLLLDRGAAVDARANV